jgi:hypothetical protein
MNINRKDPAAGGKEKSFIRLEARFTLAEYEQFLILHQQININKAALIRFCLLDQNQKIVTQVKGILEALDRLGPAIGGSGDAIARSATQTGGWNKNGEGSLPGAEKLNELLGKHIGLQKQLENNMRKLINLMGS